MAKATTAEHAALVEDLVRLVETRLLDQLEILFESSEITGPDGQSPAAPEPSRGASRATHASSAPVDAISPLRERVRIDAEVWAAQLLGPDRGRAAHTGARLVAALYPGDAPFDPPAEWWATPLGRATARSVGHPSAERASYAVAGAMLGITRQGVHDLVARGKLRRHPDGGVATASVRDRLAAAPQPPEESA